MRISVVRGTQREKTAAVTLVQNDLRAYTARVCDIHYDREVAKSARLTLYKKSALKAFRVKTVLLLPLIICRFYTFHYYPVIWRSSIKHAAIITLFTTLPFIPNSMEQNRREQPGNGLPYFVIERPANKLHIIIVFTAAGVSHLYY